MNIKWIGIAFIAAVLDIIAAVFLKENILLMSVAIIAVTCGSIIVLYWMLKDSIDTIKDQVKEVEQENKHAENIRSEFVANVSHELKTPLTSISGFIETLQAGAVNDPEIRDRFIEIIAIETARLKRLIDDILVLSDIESRMEVFKERIDVSAVTDNVSEMLSPIASKRNISIINEIDDDFELLGSEDKFRQMMVNLIENAIKYGKDGGHVWIRSKDIFGGKMITVKDDGIGIEKKDLERIAERFYRVDKSRSTKVGGTGLGLSIVKHTAALFNGELKVTSVPGEGSEFSVMIKDEGK